MPDLNKSSDPPPQKPKSPAELAAEFLRGTYRDFKARPTPAAKVAFLEAMREYLSAFDVRVDNLIDAWRDDYFETRPKKRKSKCRI